MNRDDTIVCPTCRGAGRIDAARDRTKGRYDAARKLHAKGLTYREIMKVLGYKSTCSIHAALKRSAE